MITKLKKFPLSKFVSAVTLVALLSMMVGPLNANALGMTTSKDTVTRLKISENADHTVVFTLPTGIDFDRATQTDGFHIDFPATFATSGTWTAAEFTLNDGTARTSVTPSQGAATIDCTVAAGVNNFCVAIDTTNLIFTIKPSADFTASGTAATVTFTIAGSTGNGVLTNPASVAATNIDFQMCDETAACFTSWTTSHSSQVAYGIADSDQVAISATVNSTLSFDLDTATTDTTSDAPYSVPLGTVTTTDTRVSGTTDSINYIWADLNTNASGGMIVTVQNTNGANGLVSTEVGADDIDSAAAAVTDGVENYGLCVVSVTQLTGALAIAGSYVGDSCTANTEGNDVEQLSTSPANILDTTSNPVGSGRAQIAVQASVDGATIAHSDYTDTLTFIATGTF